MMSGTGSDGIDSDRQKDADFAAEPRVSAAFATHGDQGGRFNEIDPAGRPVGSVEGWSSSVLDSSFGVGDVGNEIRASGGSSSEFREVGELGGSEIGNKGEDFGRCESRNVSMDVDEKKADCGVELSRVGSEEKGKVESADKLVGKIEEKSDKRREYESPCLADFNSMMAKAEEFSGGNGNSWLAGFGFEMGDMVWGKVKSHPWWPGHILDEAFATPSVRRSKREGHVLVAFYGDSSYGWFDPAELIPFEPNYPKLRHQTTSRTFVKAVEDAVDEVSRRRALGLACRCRKPYSFRPAEVQGYFAVDLSDYEIGFTYSVSQIKKARYSFQPREFLAYLRELAPRPMSHDFGAIESVKKKASFVAYRTAMYEEFDETYAQAFGAQPVRPSQPTGPPVQLPGESYRAPLSGRLVFAETVGNKTKRSAKLSKAKGREEKDRYLFKRRDEDKKLNIQKANRPQTDYVQVNHADASVFPRKDLHSGAEDNVLYNADSSTVGDTSSSSQFAPVNELNGRGEVSANLGPGDIPIPKVSKDLGDSREKKKFRKHPTGEFTPDGPGLVEKKKKQKKERRVSMEPGTAGEHMHVSAAADLDRPSVRAEESALLPATARDNVKVDIHRKDDAAITREKVGMGDTEHDLARLFSDLRSLALNPFHGTEKSCPTMARQIFLRFRSLVYQKSLVLSAPSESESDEAFSSGVAPPSDHPRAAGHAREIPTVKPQKSLARPEDVTKVGQKRGPSERQEDMSAKKKKKIADMKSLSSEKKAALKIQGGQQGDGKVRAAQQRDSKDIPAKPMVSTPQRGSRPVVPKKAELPARVPNQTMLIMKFPPEASLPSINELKARFARFGPLDHSATRVYWKSSQCRVVYQFKNDAEAALRFATSSNNLFGNSNVRCYLRDLVAEAAKAFEEESAKPPREDPVSVGTSQSRDEPKPVQRTVFSPATNQTLQLKSILKKASNEDGGTGTNGGNGGSRATRVKFMLDGEEGSKGDQTMVGTRNNFNNATTTFSDGTSSSSLNINNVQMAIPPPVSTISQPPPAPINMQYTEPVQRNVQNLQNLNTQLAPPIPASADISQQMISLLVRCNEVVNNLTGLFGYVPLYPL